MSRHIVVIDGHPDREPERFVHALARAYCDGARAAGIDVEHVAVAELDFPLLRSNEDYRSGVPIECIRACQTQITRADHLVVLYPLWLGSTPALLKGFLEQVLRPGFAFAEGTAERLPKGLLSGKSARIVVTMGMPAWVYRWYFGAHSLKSLERNVLALCGLGPVRADLIGGIEGLGASGRDRWLDRMRERGAKGS